MQTAIMQKQMLASYPELNGRVVVMPHPAPGEPLHRLVRPTYQGGQRLRLLYPAAGFEYKNHTLLTSMDACRHLQRDTELTVTLNSDEHARLNLPSGWLRNVGKLEPRDCLELYRQSDALFFPSILESYGLPLVEAMAVGLPVVCADLPYAHWLCEDQAIYFDPLSPTAAWRAIRELQNRLDTGWQPDWSQALSKIARDWDEVARRFLEVMGLPTVQRRLEVASTDSQGCAPFESVASGLASSKPGRGVLD
jgi:hypothetical protein